MIRSILSSRIPALVSILITGSAALVTVASGRPAIAQESPDAAGSPGSPSVVQTAISRSNRVRLASGYYLRSSDYRLVHQEITIGDFDWAAKSFSGRVTTTVSSLRAPLQVVQLDAGHQLTITRVTDPQGAPLPFEHVRDTLLVHLAKPLSFRDTTRFTVEYHGQNADGLFFVEAQGTRPRHLWSVGSKTTNHSWFPTCDLENNKETWDITITAPKEYDIISNGRRISDVPAPKGQHTAHWRMEHPASTYLLSMVIGPFATVTDHWRSVPLEYHVYRADSARARSIFAMTAKAMDLYSRLTGVSYPWPRYAQITVGDFPWGGMENLTATILTDALPAAWKPGDRPRYVYQIVPHELAHQWFGNYVTHSTWDNSWIGEGFAHFMTGQFWYSEFGTDGGEEFFVRQQQEWLATDKQERVALAGPSEDLVYARGSTVLEMLRRQLGDTLFWASIREFVKRYAYGNADSEELRQVFFAVTGQNLNWFFDDWIYSAGHPDFTVTSAYDSATHQLMLTVEQTQAPRRDSFVANGDTTFYETPAVFRAPVVVRVEAAGRTILHHGWIGQRRETITIDSVMAAPTMVVFDDNDAIAKTLRFEMPTAWLTAILDHDGNLWNTLWAIEQLQGRLKEPAAVAALRSAAARSKYRWTRARAAEVVGTAH